MMNDQRQRMDDGEGTVDEDENDGALQVESDGGGSPEAVSSEVEELRGELDTLNDRHLRLAAEFDNYRKRNDRERQTLGSRLQVDLVRPLLDVLDDLERVVTSASDADG